MLSRFSHVRLCDPTDYSPQGSSVYGILQARILERVAISTFRRSSWPRDQTCVSCLLFWQASSLSLVPPGKPQRCPAAAAAAAKLLQSCPTLCDSIDGSPPGSPVPGILQARSLEWVSISFSNAWKWKVKVKLLSRVQLLATPWTAAYQAPPPMRFSRQEYWSEVPLPSPKDALEGVNMWGDWSISVLQGVQWENQKLAPIQTQLAREEEPWGCPRRGRMPQRKTQGVCHRTSLGSTSESSFTLWLCHLGQVA